MNKAWFVLALLMLAACGPAQTVRRAPAADGWSAPGAYATLTGGVVSLRRRVYSSSAIATIAEPSTRLFMSLTTVAASGGVPA